MAKCIAQQGIRVVFGVVGIPVVEVAVAIQAEGIHFVGMRNEQAVGKLSNSRSDLYSFNRNNV